MVVTKDGSVIVAYHHRDIFDNFDSLIDYTHRSGKLRAENCSTVLVFTVGSGASLSSEGDGFYSWHFLNPIALINRDNT